MTCFVLKTYSAARTVGRSNQSSFFFFNFTAPKYKLQVGTNKNNFVCLSIKASTHVSVRKASEQEPE